MSNILQRYMNSSLKAEHDASQGNLDFKFISKILSGLVTKDVIVAKKNEMGFWVLEMLQGFNPKLSFSQNSQIIFLEYPERFVVNFVDVETLRQIDFAKRLMQNLNVIAGEMKSYNTITEDLLVKSKVDSEKNKKNLGLLKEIKLELQKPRLNKATKENLIKNIVEHIKSKVEDIPTIGSEHLGLNQNELEQVNHEVRKEKEKQQIKTIDNLQDEDEE